MKLMGLKFAIGPQCLKALTREIDKGVELAKWCSSVIADRVTPGVVHCRTCQTKHRSRPCPTKLFDENWVEQPRFFVGEKEDAELIDIRISEELHAALKSYAKRFQKTAAAVARDALERKLLAGTPHCDGCTCKAKHTGEDEKGAEQK